MKNILLMSAVVLLMAVAGLHGEVDNPNDGHFTSDLTVDGDAIFKGDILVTTSNTQSAGSKELPFNDFYFSGLAPTNYTPGVNSTKGHFTGVDVSLGTIKSTASSLASTVDRNENNIQINAFRTAVNGSLNFTPMANGYVDEFQDETGVNTSLGSNFTYRASGDYYSWGGAEILPDNLSDQLSFFYKLNDDEADTVVVDSAGLVAGTLAGGYNTEDLSTTGKINEGFLFNGSDDKIDAGDVSVEIGVSNFTSVCWMYPTAYAVSGDSWIHCVLGRDNCELRFGVNGTEDYKAKLSFYTVVSAHGTFATGPDNISLDQWTFVACVYDGTNNLLYVNNTNVASVAQTAGVITPAINYYVGGRVASGREFEGKLDAVGTWTRALSPAELTVLWNLGVGMESSGTPSGDMELIAEGYSDLSFTPSAGKVMLLIEDTSDSLTINTDVKAYASRDNGSTWLQSELTEAGSFDSNVKIWEGASTNLVGSPTTNLQWKVNSFNTTEGRLHGVAIQARE